MNLVKASGNGYKEGLDASTGVAGTLEVYWQAILHHDP